MRDVLVLNKNWLPIHIIHWKKSISLIYQTHAVSLDRDLTVFDYDMWIGLTDKLIKQDFPIVSSVNYTIAIPEIIVLTRYNQLPKKDVKFTRQNVFQRDKCICQYCNKRFRKSILTVDHVVPLAQGGKSNWKNIVTACQFCNSKKACKTPEEAKMDLVKQPSEPGWFNPLSVLAGQPKIRPSWATFLERIRM